jgi:hypothetical protein
MKDRELEVSVSSAEEFARVEKVLAASGVPFHITLIGAGRTQAIQDELRGIAESIGRLADDWGYAPRSPYGDAQWLRELADHLDGVRDAPLTDPSVLGQALGNHAPPTSSRGLPSS